MFHSGLGDWKSGDRSLQSSVALAIRIVPLSVLIPRASAAVAKSSFFFAHEGCTTRYWPTIAPWFVAPKCDTWQARFAAVCCLCLPDRRCYLVDIRITQTGRRIVDPALDLVSRARADDDIRAEYDSGVVRFDGAALPRIN